MFWTVLAVGLGAHGWWSGSWIEIGFGIFAGIIGVRRAVMQWDKPGAFANCVATVVALGFLIASMAGYDQEKAKTRFAERVVERVTGEEQKSARPQKEKTQIHAWESSEELRTYPPTDSLATQSKIATTMEAWPIRSGERFYPNAHGKKCAVQLQWNGAPISEHNIVIEARVYGEWISWPYETLDQRSAKTWWDVDGLGVDVRGGANNLQYMLWCEDESPKVEQVVEAPQGELQKYPPTDVLAVGRTLSIKGRPFPLPSDVQYGLDKAGEECAPQLQWNGAPMSEHPLVIKVPLTHGGQLTPWPYEALDQDAARVWWDAYAVSVDILGDAQNVQVVLWCDEANHEAQAFPETKQITADGDVAIRATVDMKAGELYRPDKKGKCVVQAQWKGTLNGPTSILVKLEDGSYYEDYREMIAGQGGWLRRWDVAELTPYFSPNTKDAKYVLWCQIPKEEPKADQAAKATIKETPVKTVKKVELEPVAVVETKEAVPPAPEVEKKAEPAPVPEEEAVVIDESLRGKVALKKMSFKDSWDASTDGREAVFRREAHYLEESEPIENQSGCVLALWSKGDFKYAVRMQTLTGKEVSWTVDTTKPNGDEPYGQLTGCRECKQETKTMRVTILGGAPTSLLYGKYCNQR